MKKILNTSLLILILLLAVFLTVFSERAADLARDALRVCALSVIPALFPYMVVSNMLVSSELFKNAICRIPLYKPYGLSKAAVSPIILGALCGFPVGALTAVKLYKEGTLSKTEAEVLISCANNTGPSFVVFVVGASFFKSIPFGWLLYVFQLVSSFLCAILVNRVIFPFEKTKSNRISKKGSKPDFFRSVADSASSMITIPGFIVFFSVISGFFLPYVSKELSPLIASVLEFTGGCRLSAQLGGMKGRFLAGLSIGWSGISVFCQTAAFTSREGLSLKRLLCTKALQGIMTGALCTLPIFNISAAAGAFPEFYEQVSLSFSSSPPAVFSSVVLCVFLIKNLLKGHKY